uniref:C-type lectin domain-containing protein n=1 Tax=Poecilia latipinna TaxID=48699 RepID=A0A3B3VG02_9TELE
TKGFRTSLLQSISGTAMQLPKINIIFTKVSLSDLFHRLMDPGCKPCLHDWIFFQKKCYLFYDEPAPWKTWEQSRRFCQDRRADLVVIDDLEEQVKSDATYARSLELIWKFLENRSLKVRKLMLM